MQGAKKKHKLLSRVPSRARCDFGHCSAVSETVYAGTRQGDKNRSKWRAKHKRDTHGVMPSMKRGSHSGPYVFRCSTCGFTKGFAVSSSKRSCKAAHSCPRAAVKVESGGGGDGKPGLALKRKRGGGGGDSEGGEGMSKRARGVGRAGEMFGESADYGRRGSSGGFGGGGDSAGDTREMDKFDRLCGQEQLHVAMGRTMDRGMGSHHDNTIIATMNLGMVDATPSFDDTGCSSEGAGGEAENELDDGDSPSIGSLGDDSARMTFSGGGPCHCCWEAALSMPGLCSFVRQFAKDYQARVSSHCVGHECCVAVSMQFL
jgi:hypothetical protein